MIGFAARNELISTADSHCMCPGQTITYECTVVGGISTVWSGSVIGPGCESSLFHSAFQNSSESITIVCDNGTVVGRRIGVNNNCYTSQLSILLTPNLDQRTIQCSVDNGISATVIGTARLSLITGIIKTYNYNH